MDDGWRSVAATPADRKRGMTAASHGLVACAQRGNRLLWRRVSSARRLERHHQHVAMRRLGGIERRHRRDAVEHAGIVDQCGIQCVGEREAAQQAAVVGVDGGGAALDVGAVDQQHQHVVDAIAVYAFRCRLAGFVGPGLDAELVHLDVPTPDSRCQGAETVAAEAEDATQAGAVGDRRQYGLKPALDVALQGLYCRLW